MYTAEYSNNAILSSAVRLKMLQIPIYLVIHNGSKNTNLVQFIYDL